MAKRMLIDALHAEETRVVIADDKQVYDFDFVSATKKQLKGNIYLAKITRVEPSLQAAFVEYGGGKQGFLPFAEIHPDYYQIPVSDRKRLMEEVESEDEREFVDEPQAQTGEQAQEETSAASSEAEMTELEPAPENQEQPSFLTEGAIEISPEEPSDTIDEAPVEQQDNAEEALQPAEEGEIRAASEESQSEEGLETLPNEDEEMRERPKKTFTKRYKIQEVIRRGQVVLVQVIKEERGNKGVSLTTYLSLAGRYCVLMPNSHKDGGISRKIMSPEDRKRLKQISAELKLSKGMSVIIRTAGMDRARAEIKRDYDYLVKVWNSIREETLKSNAPALIYEESDLIKRAIRDQYANDIDEVIVEGDEGYHAAKEFMKLLLPSHTPKIKHYKEPTPLFYAYDIEEQLLSMHDPIVKLRSGGYIVINPTEALISIDVNSGRATGERNIEETAAKTNLEAAAEVARQLRLRDLAGLIVIDFIDMLESRNRRAVEKLMKDSLKADRAKIQLGRISPFGLMEMSRQRLRPSISETNMVQCPHCEGRGYIRSSESMSIQIIRSLEKEASSGTWSSLRLIASQTVALHLLNNKRDNLRDIEQRYGITIQVFIDVELGLSEFNLEKMRRGQSERNAGQGDRDRGRRRDRDDRPRPARNNPAPAAVQEEALAAPAEIEEDAPESAEGENTRRDDRTGNGEGRRRGRRRGRRGGRNRDGRPGSTPSETMDSQEQDSSIEEQESAVQDHPTEANDNTQDAQQQRRPRGERGGRGRRRWRERDGRREGSDAVAGAQYADNSDGRDLPAFATENPVPMEQERKREPEMAHAAAESAPRDPNAQPKKGWWQKIIDLDD